MELEEIYPWMLHRFNIDVGPKPRNACHTKTRQPIALSLCPYAFRSHKQHKYTVKTAIFDKNLKHRCM